MANLEQLRETAQAQLGQAIHAATTPTSPDHRAWLRYQAIDSIALYTIARTNQPHPPTLKVQPNGDPPKAA